MCNCKIDCNSYRQPNGWNPFPCPGKVDRMNVLRKKYPHWNPNIPVFDG